MHFYLRISPSDTTEVIISISKKVAKKAVERNTIKRRVRAVMRNILKSLKPATYLVVAKVGAGEVSGEELKAELKKLLGL